MKMVSQYTIEDGTKMISIWNQSGEEVSNVMVLKEIEPGIYKVQ